MNRYLNAGDAEALRAAAAVLRRRFGGLATTIAVLDEKAATLDAQDDDDCGSSLEMGPRHDPYGTDCRHTRRDHPRDPAGRPLRERKARQMASTDLSIDNLAASTSVGEVFMSNASRDAQQFPAGTRVRAYAITSEHHAAAGFYLLIVAGDPQWFAHVTREQFTLSPRED